jgi:tungstate transport system permease protein
VDFVVEGFREAGRLLLSGDPETYHALWVSVLCTTAAVVVAFVAGVPYGAWLGLYRPRGHGTQAFLLRLGMFVPTVIVGLIVFALLSRRGLFGGLDLLYTKLAIGVGLTLLAFPLFGTFAHGAAASLDPVVVETARTLGAGRVRAMLKALGEVRTTIGASVLLAFARCLTELGIATTVGGNLRLETRTLPGTIQLELSKGEFAAALAPGLLLIALSLLVALLAMRVERGRSR